VSVRWLEHVRVRLALHALRDSGEPRLLILHELGGRAPAGVPPELAAWPGGVWALEFTGHGRSSVPRGGGYHPEVLMGDASAALDAIGPAALVGFGLGGYVALLVAGARPESVRGAILCDGAGLAGGGAEPGAPKILTAQPGPSGVTPDPFALLELSSDVRPPDYAAEFATHARSGSGPSVLVCARERPAWLEAVLAVDSVAVATLDEALEVYAKGE
jgi:pimeloyl-ACP methyl ester carboxylesterase